MREACAKATLYNSAYANAFSKIVIALLRNATNSCFLGELKMRETNKKKNTRSYQRNVQTNKRGGAAAITPQRRKQLVTFAALTMVVALLLASLIGAMTSVVSPDFALAATNSPYAETAHVGEGIGEENGEQYKYSGVNSMVGTLISWKNYTSHTESLGNWFIDDTGFIVWGSSGGSRNPTLTYAVPQNNSLSSIKLIKANNGANGLSASSTIKPAKAGSENVTLSNWHSQDNELGAYFTIGHAGASPSEMAADWNRALDRYLV